MEQKTLEGRKLALAVAALTFCACAQAQGNVQWRLLGPVHVHHEDSNGAELMAPQGAGGIDCTRTAVNESGVKFCNGIAAKQEVAYARGNPAIGIERSVIGEEYTDKAFVNFVRDSYSNESLMLGVGRSWPVATWGEFRVEAGASAGLWWRSVWDGQSLTPGGEMSFCTNDQVRGNICSKTKYPYYVSDIRRAVIPFVFPFISIEHRKSGIGMNIAIAPKLRIGNVDTAPTNTLMIQLTFKIDI